MFELILGVLFISFLVVGVLDFLHDYFKENNKNFFISCFILIFCILSLIYYRHYTREHEIYNIVKNASSIEEIKENVGEYFED